MCIRDRHLAVSELAVPAMPEARIVVYTPRDADTREKMPRTRRAAPAAPTRAQPEITGHKNLPGTQKHQECARRPDQLRK